MNEPQQGREPFSDEIVIYDDGITIDGAPVPGAIETDNIFSDHDRIGDAKILHRVYVPILTTTQPRAVRGLMGEDQ